MNPEDKKFFEELAHADEEISLSPEADLTGATAVAADSEKKLSKKSREELAEWLDEGQEGQLAIDVFQTPDEIIIESTIAGVNPEDLDVDITPESVTIRGKRAREKRISDEDYFYQECYWGRFSRSIILPQEIDAENSVANLKNGVLTIRMPKINRQKAKKLKIKSE